MAIDQNKITCSALIQPLITKRYINDEKQGSVSHRKLYILQEPDEYVVGYNSSGSVLVRKQI